MLELQERSDISEIEAKMREAVRVYALAKNLSINPKQILSLCEKSGIRAVSALSFLRPDHCRLIEAMIRGEDPGNENNPSVVPVWRPPPTLVTAVMLKPPGESTQS
jgi:hypothetical protein